MASEIFWYSGSDRSTKSLTNRLAAATSAGVAAGAVAVACSAAVSVAASAAVMVMVAIVVPPPIRWMRAMDADRHPRTPAGDCLCKWPASCRPKTGGAGIPIPCAPSAHPSVGCIFHRIDASQDVDAQRLREADTAHITMRGEHHGPVIVIIGSIGAHRVRPGSRRADPAIARGHRRPLGRRRLTGGGANKFWLPSTRGARRQAMRDRVVIWARSRPYHRKPPSDAEFSMNSCSRNRALARG